MADVLSNLSADEASDLSSDLSSDLPANLAADLSANKASDLSSDVRLNVSLKPSVRSRRGSHTRRSYLVKTKKQKPEGEWF